MFTVAQLKESPSDQKCPFSAVVVLRKTAIRRARNDSEFLMVELGDRTGVFHVVCFQNSNLYHTFSNMTEGTIVRVEGVTGYYQDRFSPNLTRVNIMSESEAAEHMANLIETSAEDPGLLWKEMQAFIESIGHPRLRETVRIAIGELEDGFRATPGAISMHHAYRSGLMEHTVHMARAARALLPLYTEVPGDLAMAGILLHDLGKALEYTTGLATRRTREGILQGHVVLGYRQARRAAMKAKLEADLLERLEHIILSHQGELEWGAAVKAATPEAVFVSMVDNLDAKMGMVQQALRVTPEGEEFSEFVPGLGAPLRVSAPAEAIQPEPFTLEPRLDD